MRSESLIDLRLGMALSLVCLCAWPVAASADDTEKVDLETLTDVVRPDKHPTPLFYGPSKVGSVPQASGKRSLGTWAASTSPGVTVGTTWYDNQHNGSMGRMIDWGSNGTKLIHFAWMYMPSADDMDARRYQYNFYNIQADTLGTSVSIGQERAGYVGIDVTGDNRAVVGGHEMIGAISQDQFYWETSEASASFDSYTSRVPMDVAAWGGSYGQSVIWPKFRYQEGPTDTVLHVIAQVSPPTSDPQVVYYFRKVGANDQGSWDYPPTMVDTVFVLSQDIAASRTTGKVALVWAANLAGDDGAANQGLEYPNCDINSGTAPFVQLDNDIYYMVSTDQGMSWGDRYNITCNVDGEAGYRPYSDLSALIASDDNLHIVWSGRGWPADATSGGYIGKDCSIFHWSEDNPSLSYVHRAEWDHTYCDGGAWQLNVSKMTISECDGKFYVIFVQFNDIPNGIEDDCAQRGLDGSDPEGAANGDLWVTVSADTGLTWGAAYNLTNTYSPGCDSVDGAGGPCNSEHWPSMARFGRQNQPGENWTMAEIIDPSGGAYTGDYYLDVQYIYDPVAGGVVQDEGGWHLADVRWFRLACVDPLFFPELSLSLNEIDYPAWTQHGIEQDSSITIRNDGTGELVYTITPEEDNGPSGWLTYSGFDGSVSPGVENAETGTVTMNTGGLVNSPGTIEYLSGRLIFSSNADSSPDTLGIFLMIAESFDIDGDGVDNIIDNCPLVPNPGQEDANGIPPGDACCCVDIRGNVNEDLDGLVNISDITYLVDYLFGIPVGPAPPCREEGNANGDEDDFVNVSDITYLVDYLFGVPLGPAPPACP